MNAQRELFRMSLHVFVNLWVLWLLRYMSRSDLCYGSWVMTSHIEFDQESVLRPHPPFLTNETITCHSTTISNVLCIRQVQGCTCNLCTRKFPKMATLCGCYLDLRYRSCGLATASDYAKELSKGSQISSSREESGELTAISPWLMKPELKSLCCK